MSARHREHRSEIVGYHEHPKARDRRAESRRARRQANHLLHQVPLGFVADRAELDMLSDILPDLRAVKVDAPAEDTALAARVTSDTGVRRFRVWKTRLWKRRTMERHRRNEIERHLLDEAE